METGDGTKDNEAGENRNRASGDGHEHSMRLKNK